MGHGDLPARGGYSKRFELHGMGGECVSPLLWRPRRLQRTRHGGDASRGGADISVPMQVRGAVFESGAVHSLCSVVASSAGSVRAGRSRAAAGSHPVRASRRTKRARRSATLNGGGPCYLCLCLYLELTCQWGIAGPANKMRWWARRNCVRSRSRFAPVPHKELCCIV